MSAEDLKIFDNIIELAIKNSNLIEIMHGYCKNIYQEEFNPEALFEIINIIKNNQKRLIEEIDKSDFELANLLLKHGLLE